MYNKVQVTEGLTQLGDKEEGYCNSAWYVYNFEKK